MLSRFQTTNMWLGNFPPVRTRLADFNWYIYHAKTRGGCAPPQRPLTNTETGEIQEPEQLIVLKITGKQAYFLTVGIWPSRSSWFTMQRQVCYFCQSNKIKENGFSPVLLKVVKKLHFENSVTFTETTQDIQRSLFSLWTSFKQFLRITKCLELQNLIHPHCVAVAAKFSEGDVKTSAHIKKTKLHGEKPLGHKWWWYDFFVIWLNWTFNTSRSPTSTVKLPRRPHTRKKWLEKDRWEDGRNGRQCGDGRRCRVERLGSKED